MVKCVKKSTINLKGNDTLLFQLLRTITFTKQIAK